MIRKTSLSAVLFAAFLTTAAAAGEPAAAPAWPSTVTVTGRVEFGDLDLGTEPALPKRAGASPAPSAISAAR